MKNACIVLRNTKIGILSVRYAPVIDAFLSGGYDFSEIRFLPFDDTSAFHASLSELRKTAEILVVVVDSVLFENTAKEILSEGLEEELGFQNGVRIFKKDSFTLFLISSNLEQAAENVRNICLSYLEKKYSRRFDKLVLRAVGADERTVRKLIADCEKKSGERLSYRYETNYGETVLEVVYDSAAPKMLVDEVLRFLTEGLKEYLYSLDGTPLERQLVRLLKVRGKKISVAESFTGGGVGAKIVSVPGASEVYFEGLNTYDERAKIKRLGVSEYTLKSLGAVSDQTAYEMAAGLLASGDANITVATTGFAGPNLDGIHPVGLCYIAVGLPEKVYVYKHRFTGTREEITETAINYALFAAYKQLKNI